MILNLMLRDCVVVASSTVLALGSTSTVRLYCGRLRAWPVLVVRLVMIMACHVIIADGFGGGSNVTYNVLFNTCRESGDHGRSSCAVLLRR